MDHAGIRSDLGWLCLGKVQVFRRGDACIRRIPVEEEAVPAVDSRLVPEVLMEHSAECSHAK